MKRILLACLIVLSMSSVAFAASSVTLAWDYGTAPADLAGFRIYHKSGTGVVVNPAAKVAEVGASARQAQAQNLGDGQACFVATAFDARGNESAKSNEVCVDLDTTAPPTPGSLRVDVVVTVQVP